MSGFERIALARFASGVWAWPGKSVEAPEYPLIEKSRGVALGNVSDGAEPLEATVGKDKDRAPPVDPELDPELGVGKARVGNDGVDGLAADGDADGWSFDIDKMRVDVDGVALEELDELDVEVLAAAGAVGGLKVGSLGDVVELAGVAVRAVVVRAVGVALKLVGNFE